MHIKSLTYDELINKDINVKFAKVLCNPAAYHTDLNTIIGKTDWNYSIPSGATDVIPLWDQNADSYVRWTRNGNVEYVLLFHDEQEWELVAISEQGIMAEFWVKWAEFQETNDECHRFADAIGFKHCEEALNHWANNYEQFEQWKKELKD